MSCGDCTSDKLNCNSHSVCSGGKWLLMLYRLEFWEVCFVFFCRVFLKQEKSIIYVFSYRGRLSCAVYVGYVKAGIQEFSLFSKTGTTCYSLLGS